MICRLEDLRKKEVIDILTGERLGYIDDAEMNIEKSSVQSFVIYGRERFFGILGREDDVVIPCSEIKVVGNDVVLIKHSETSYVTDFNVKKSETS
ncbi:MAG: YlmC/YmxH family sporulation protein [Ruminococcus flavefaciens]|nr:YlmC/YmxH family sporulation protein [Ruminococcus flavefaciens]